MRICKTTIDKIKGNSILNKYTPLNNFLIFPKKKKNLKTYGKIFKLPKKWDEESNN